MLSNDLEHIFKQFFLLYSDKHRQKLAQMAAKERYIVLEMGVSEAKRKEKIQMEKTVLMMIQKVEEMEEKIEEKEVELEDECMYIEDVGQSIYELTVDIEYGEFSQEGKKEKEYKKNELEKKKDGKDCPI